jgi:hypothetical protein
MRVLLGWSVLTVALGAGAYPLSAAPAADVLPARLSSYRSADLATAASLPAAVPAGSPGREEHFAFIEEGEGAEAPQSYWPVLYSALVPGAGELSMGYEKRGIALLAAEITAWAGYFYYNNDGLDKRDEYEAFADQYWNQDKWIDDHPCPTLPPTDRTLEDIEQCGQESSGSGLWPGYIPWVSKEEDKQHYYENIGKYDWYISGWSDWDPAADPYEKQTDLRTQYRAMRGESNDALDTANSFIWLSVAARAFSIAETAIIVHNRRGAAKSAAGGAGGGTPVSVRARPRGYSGGEVALEVRFK